MAYSRCFGCGQENPIGLALKVTSDGQKAFAEFLPSELYQGWPTFLHGGIVCALLDEVMSYVPFGRGLKTVTARLNVEFMNPAPLDKKLHIEATATRVARRVIDTAGFIALEDGTVIARGSAVMLVLTRKQAEALGL